MQTEGRGIKGVECRVSPDTLPSLHPLPSADVPRLLCGDDGREIRGAKEGGTRNSWCSAVGVTWQERRLEDEQRARRLDC